MRNSTGPCSVADCDKPAHTRKLCQMHYFRLRRNGDPLALRGYTQGRGHNHANWVGDRITYIGAHCRLQRERGPATQHACIDCGAPAIEWSYNHSDPNELHDARRKCEYSADPGNYDPRCKSCHNRIDQADRERLPNGQYAPSVRV